MHARSHWAVRLLAGIFAIGLGTLQAAEPPTKGPTDSYDGKVASITKGSIGILSAQGENKTFALTAESKITLNGKPANWSDIGVGTAVKITAANDANGLVAKTVEVRSVEQPPRGPAE